MISISIITWSKACGYFYGKLIYIYTFFDHFPKSKFISERGVSDLHMEIKVRLPAVQKSALCSYLSAVI